MQAAFAGNSNAMSLDTIISSGLRPARADASALVLMGGGARTAYQAGVLRAIGAMRRLQPGHGARFPFRILVGTSAGAINCAYLASVASQGLDALALLAEFWLKVRSSDIYELELSGLARLSRLAAAWGLSVHARRHGALLDNTPMVDTLHRAISLQGIETTLQTGVIDSLAVTASSYSSGVHWTFCHGARDQHARRWSRPGRRSEFQPITIEHLAASSAIPFIFPATALWVDGHREFFGDGSMRQVSPLSPAMHLGAQRVMVIGVGQPERSGLGAASPAGDPTGAAGGRPSLGMIAGHAMASVFHDTVQADVEQTQRVNETIRQLPREVAAVLPYRTVDVLAIHPSQSLDALAQLHAGELPDTTRNALRGLGALRGGGAALASYLLFEPGFTRALIELGERDAWARKDEITAFMKA